MAADSRAPCIIGVGQHTWHPEDVGEEGAPEPLLMWERVARAAAADSGAANVLEQLDSLQIVYCQTWQYDDAVARLSDALGTSPSHQHYSGIGGTMPQVLVQNAGVAILAGEADLAMVTGAEALATQRRYKKQGERATYSYKPDEKRPFPWEAPFHPAEMAHDVYQAWLTFAIFENARRARFGIELADYRTRLGEMMAPMTEIAAANPNAWYRIARSADEIATPAPDNRMVGYPYTKYMVSVMDVDMAGAVILASEEKADALGVPRDQRVYLRGWCYATDPVYVAEHTAMSRSPAMAAASGEALRIAGTDVDDVAHFDLYSCFGSSVNFARDALGLADDETRPLTVTGGLPYHGGAGSDYLTHSIATMTETLRADPGSVGLVSGVGMHMTKHVYAAYSTAPGPVAPPEQDAVQARLDAAGSCPIRAEHDGEATVAAYSVVHGRDGGPEWGVVVCDVAGGARAYGKITAPELLDSAEAEELVGRTVQLTPQSVSLPTGEDATMNIATF